MKFSKIEFTVGLFMVVGILAGVVLALQVAGLALDSRGSSYTLLAKFDNIGGLKVRSPVKIGGVVVGRVASIHIDAKSFTPVVELQIQSQYDDLPSTSSASILTAGLLGNNISGSLPVLWTKRWARSCSSRGTTLRTPSRLSCWKTSSASSSTVNPNSKESIPCCAFFRVCCACWPVLA